VARVAFGKPDPRCFLVERSISTPGSRPTTPAEQRPPSKDADDAVLYALKGGAAPTPLLLGPRVRPIKAVSSIASTASGLVAALGDGRVFGWGDFGAEGEAQLLAALTMLRPSLLALRHDGDVSAICGPLGRGGAVPRGVYRWRVGDGDAARVDDFLALDLASTSTKSVAMTVQGRIHVWDATAGRGSAADGAVGAVESCPVRRIACGEDSCVALTFDGTVRSVDLTRNSRNAALGAAVLKDAKCVAAGGSMHLALTSDGVYVWGACAASCPAPRRVCGALAEAVTVASSALGPRGGICASSAGNVYVWDHGEKPAAVLVEHFSAASKCIEAVWATCFQGGTCYATVSAVSGAPVPGRQAAVEILILGLGAPPHRSKGKVRPSDPPLGDFWTDAWYSCRVLVRDGSDRDVADAPLLARGDRVEAVVLGNGDGSFELRLKAQSGTANATLELASHTASKKVHLRFVERQRPCAKKSGIHHTSSSAEDGRNAVEIRARNGSGEPADASLVEWTCSPAGLLAAFVQDDASVVRLETVGDSAATADHATISATVEAPSGARIHVRGSPLRITLPRRAEEPPSPQTVEPTSPPRFIDAPAESPAPAPACALEDPTSPTAQPLLESTPPPRPESPPDWVTVDLSRQGALDADEARVLEVLWRRHSAASPLLQ